MNKAFIVTGGPGAGKSTYAAGLASKTGSILLDIDTVTERLVQSGLSAAGKSPDDRDSSYFKTTYREPIYETLFDIARENLRRFNAVIVGPFTKEMADSEWPEKLARKLEAEIEVHYIFCTAEERKRRMEARNHPRDRQKLENWPQFLEYYRGEERPVFKHIFVDSGATRP